MTAMSQRSNSRRGSKVRVLAIHTTEGLSYDAEGLRDAPWWEGSSHAIADEETLLSGAPDGCVPYDRASWTLRSGNPWSENCELVAMAGWKRGDWLRRPGLLRNAALWLATRSTATGIPLVKLTPRQYRAGWSGVIGHIDQTIAYGGPPPEGDGGTHWDPGPHFPWDVVLAQAKQIQDGDNMPAPEEFAEALLKADGSPLEGKQSLRDVWSQTWTNSKRIADVEAKLDQVIALLTPAAPAKE